MNKLLNILIVVFSVVILLSLGAIFIFYNPSIITKHITEHRQEIPKLEQQRNPEEATTANNQENSQKPILSEEEFTQLKSLVSKFFVYIKEGIVSHPALIFKVTGTPNGTEIHLITFSTMEWQFIKLNLGSLNLKTPDEVYICEDGIVDIVYRVKSYWPPEIVRGNLAGEGILVIPSEKSTFNFQHFNGICTDNGFVFNPGGELAGLCFGSKFIDAEDLYRELSFACRLVYQKEEKNGNL